MHLSFLVGAAAALVGGTMSEKKSDKPYGSWESPITSKAITAGSVGLGGLKVVIDDDGKEDKVFWTEMRPQEGGRYVLCQYDESSDNKKKDISPPDSNVRTRVHEYGGGAVTFGADNLLFFSEFTTQQLHKLTVTTKDTCSSSTSSEPMTPTGYRFADGVYDATRKTIFSVREDHSNNPAPKDVVNEIVAIDTTTTTTTASKDSSNTVTVVVATGNDFFAAPRLSTTDATQKLAYITWNHPNMPWDATQLKVVTLSSASRHIVMDGMAHTDSHTVIAGVDGDTSVLQPLWHPHTGDLFYISDESGFYNIYKATMPQDFSTTPPASVNVLPMEFDFGGAAPGWSLGQQGFTFLQDGRLVATYTKQGISILVVANVAEPGPATQIQEFSAEDSTLPRQFGGVVAGSGTALYFLGGSPSTPTCLYKWDLSDAQQQQPPVLLASSSSLQFPSSVISTPQQITFATTLGNAYGYYYPPTNGNYTCTTESAPPLLVKAHGGPTACASTTFNAGIQYWTSRGFAVLDVDYGGSTGYGREYRRRLRKSWGIVDIDDVCAGAKHLVEQQLADKERLCIDGGSAGGYTTLGALAFRNDVFKAGCSLYGVGDLTALAGDTHKFESRYLDGLVGPYPQDEAIYKQRSPIESVDTLSCPILLLQGMEDKIVPPNQAETMHQALLQKGIPTCLKMYEGEQHGFRKAENIQDALDSELAFYGKVFGFDVPGGIDLKIDNM
ncbi:Acylamino-acid-releasing enzyme [Seminavis robusta]|uniref:Acylamino-acid-releasing enzyme n=1 Tax=Seminavis robusta TaxID=568900 RepID=A0A9N8EV47_9STRA|nr:Acylamino-acid-releasing enzyme [Seminavis robusta]|eukprot:Sro2054_g312750.1 Acylamino-acid-releasing enzyme (725) ;mRNA; f:11215-13389